MSALLEGTWTVGADAAANTMTNTSLSLKSNKWAATGGIVDGIAAQAHYIGAKIEVKADGTMIVSYDPASIKDGNY